MGLACLVVFNRRRYDIGVRESSVAGDLGAERTLIARTRIDRLWHATVSLVTQVAKHIIDQRRQGERLGAGVANLYAELNGASRLL